MKEQLKIEINPDDLHLDDHSLYLRIYERIEDQFEIMPDSEYLQGEITKAINHARGRILCPVCQGHIKIMTNCFACNRRGYINDLRERPAHGDSRQPKTL